MDICHRSNAELEPKLQIERQCRALGPCASQMTVANIMDVFTRLTDCDEQSAVNAVSAYTLVKLEDAPRLQKKIRNPNVQMFGYVFHDKRSKSWGDN